MLACVLLKNVVGMIVLQNFLSIVQIEHLQTSFFWQNRCHPMLTNVLQTFLQVNECSTLAELESLEVDVCYTLVCDEICLQNKCILLLVNVLSVNCPKLMCRIIANKCCMCSTLLLLHIYSVAHTKQSFLVTNTGKILNVIITCNNNRTNLKLPIFLRHCLLHFQKGNSSNLT